jgi:hypothetical protein
MIPDKHAAHMLTSTFKTVTHHAHLMVLTLS